MARTTLAVIQTELKAQREWFEHWCNEVYEKGLEYQERAHTLELENNIRRWSGNEEAHKRIEARLDLLNGFRNKVMAVLAIIGFASPLALAVWAIITKV